MNAVIYRFNPTLATRVTKAQPDFVHAFPAEFSIEEIKQGLKAVLKAAYDKMKELGSEDLYYHVDGTVLSAGSERLGSSRLSWRPKLIRQDDVNAYDKYAEHVAEEAKRVNQSKEPLVVIVRDRIADHNSEVFDPMREDADGVYLMDAEHAATHNWVNRLQKHDIRIRVIAARWFENEVQREGGVRVNGGFTRRLRDVVVVCDHHNGNLKDLIGECGGTWLNAYPNYSDSDFLSA